MRFFGELKLLKNKSHIRGFVPFDFICLPQRSDVAQSIRVARKTSKIKPLSFLEEIRDESFSKKLILSVFRAKAKN